MAFELSTTMSNIHNTLLSIPFCPQSTLTSAASVKKWIPSIKNDIEYYLQVSELLSQNSFLSIFTYLPCLC